MNLSQDAKEHLTRARAVLAERGWTQNAYARDEQQRGVSPRSESAICWCAIGALLAVVDDSGLVIDETRELASVILARGGRVIEAENDDPEAVVQNWNDDPGRTQEEVVELFDEAIAELRT